MWWQARERRKGTVPELKRCHISTVALCLGNFFDALRCSLPPPRTNKTTGQQNYLKSAEQILIKRLGHVDSGPMNRWLHFGDVPDTFVFCKITDGDFILKHSLYIVRKAAWGIPVICECFSSLRSVFLSARCCCIQDSQHRCSPCCIWRKIGCGCRTTAEPPLCLVGPRRWPLTACISTSCLSHLPGFFPRMKQKMHKRDVEVIKWCISLGLYTCFCVRSRI